MSDAIRITLMEFCRRFVNDRIAGLEKAIGDAQASAASETKSSMGDKYETARAMAQQEADNSKIQLSEAFALRNVLNKISTQSPGETVALGSIVFTSQHNYFISIPAGAIQTEGQTFLAISMVSPIGKLLLGKRGGEKLVWQGKAITIDRVD